MKFDELINKVRTIASGVDASNKDFLAVQVNVTGKNSGVFYVEIKDHRINVEPYDYHDRNCAITIDMTNLNKLIDGKLDPILAFTTGKLKVDGDAGKALEFANLVRNK